MPRTHSFGLDYLLYVNLCPTNTPPGFLRLTFYCCIVRFIQFYHIQRRIILHKYDPIYFRQFLLQYDPRSRPTFVEIAQKLEMLLDKYDNIPKILDTNTYKFHADDAKISKKPATKRYSVDNYCSNWLRNSVCNATGSNDVVGASSTATTSASVTPLSLESSYPFESSDNAHSRPLDTNHFMSNKLQHRRSLSENIIPFPPHTTPSDKARCHLINRKHSQLIASTDALDESNMQAASSSSIETGADYSMGIFCNTTLRKVAETMFLKDPQYKPHMNSQTYGRSNPFTTLTQLKGVKKIIGASPSTYTAGTCDLFSSCFEICVTKDTAIFPQRNVVTAGGITKPLPQAKSLPSSPKITQRKLPKLDKFGIQLSPKGNGIFDRCLDDDAPFVAKANVGECSVNSYYSNNVSTFYFFIYNYINCGFYRIG